MFLSLNIIDIWNLILLCSRDCLVRNEMFSSFPDLYPLNVWNTTLPFLNQKISSDIAKLRTTALKERRGQYSQVLEILISKHGKRNL